MYGLPVLWRLGCKINYVNARDSSNSVQNDRVEIRLVALHVVDVMRGSAARTGTRLQPQQEAVGADYARLHIVLEFNDRLQCWPQQPGSKCNCVLPHFHRPGQQRMDTRGNIWDARYRL